MRRPLIPLVLAATVAAACGNKPPAAPPPLAPPVPKPGPAPEPPPPTTDPETKSVTIAGLVRDLDGNLIDGAVVALVPENSLKAAAVVETSKIGRFSFVAPAGRYGLTATSIRGAVYEDVRDFTAPSTEVGLRLDSGGTLVSFSVTTPKGLVPRDTRIAIFRHSNFAADLFYVKVGRALARLPAGEYTVALESDDYLADALLIDTSPGKWRPDIVIEATRKAPPPDEVVAWLKNASIPLAGVEAGHGFDDLKLLKKMIGEARVVALGEATHGTREFFQLEHRLLEYMVSELGFTVFAIEANWPESLAVDDYVMTGKGDARTALAGMYFWIWNTEEVLDLIEWMRRWNADRKHKKKVHFYGFDMQYTPDALVGVIAYLESVDPAYAREIEKTLALFGTKEARTGFAQFPEKDREAIAATLPALRKRFADDKLKKKWIKATSAREWAVAEHQAAILEQAHSLYTAEDAFDVRDRAMADNLRWILDTEPKGTRVVVWAHDGHVDREGARKVDMGQHLATELGQDYLAFGFVFSEENFRAVPAGGGDAIEFTVEPAPEWDVSQAFVRAGLTLSITDLRSVPVVPGVVAEWLGGLHTMRSIGSGFDPSWPLTAIRLGRSFDAVIFVDKTTASRPNPKVEPPAGD